jgi:chorismate--pyruvate lyase
LPAPGDPAWRPVSEYSTARLAPRERDWLLDEGSLTSRLIELSGGEFAVNRLYQGWRYPLPSEARLLRLPQRQQALVREVELVCSGQVVVFARSVFPHSSLTGSLGHLRKLRNQSLGALLFSHPGMRRTPFEIALLAGSSAYLPTHLQQAGNAWARRSRFIIDDQSLLVSEVFLESFRPWHGKQSPRRSTRGRIVASS